MIKRVITKSSMKDSASRQDLLYWLGKSPNERVSTVEVLRRQGIAALHVLHSGAANPLASIFLPGQSVNAPRSENGLALCLYTCIRCEVGHRAGEWHLRVFEGPDDRRPFTFIQPERKLSTLGNTQSLHPGQCLVVEMIDVRIVPGQVTTG